MNLDLFAAITVALGAWTGWTSGSMLQLGRLAAVVLAAVLGRMMVVPVTGFYLRMTTGVVETTVAMVFVVVYAIGWIVFWLMLQRLTEEVRDVQDRTPADRVGGAVVGAAKGLVLAFVIVSVVVTLGMGKGRDPETWNETTTGRIGAEKNFLASAAAQVEREAAVDERPALRGWERGEDWSDEDE